MMKKIIFNYLNKLLKAKCYIGSSLVIIGVGMDMIEVAMRQSHISFQSIILVLSGFIFIAWNIIEEMNIENKINSTSI